MRLVLTLNYVVLLFEIGFIIIKQILSTPFFSYKYNIKILINFKLISNIIEHKMLEYANKITLKGDNIMKFAVITDIHGNFDALQTVLDDIDSRDDIEKIYNLGDNIGLDMRQIKYWILYLTEMIWK